MELNVQLSEDKSLAAERDEVGAEEESSKEGDCAEGSGKKFLAF